MSSIEAIAETEANAAPLHFHFLGQVGLDAGVALQERLVAESVCSPFPRSVILMCEHSPLISIGRAGSRAQIRLSNAELQRRQLELRWMNRGGGCVLHGPGQLSVYAMISLEACGWSVGEFMRRFQCGIVDALSELKIATNTYPGSFGVWGRTGQLASLGVAVRDGITCHGAFLNVSPTMTNYSFVESSASALLPSDQKPNMSCLLAERGRAITMSATRSTLVRHLAGSFGSEHYHLHTGHPLLGRERVPA